MKLPWNSPLKNEMGSGDQPTVNKETLFSGSTETLTTNHPLPPKNVWRQLIYERPRSETDLSSQSQNPRSSDPSSLVYEKLSRGGGFQVKIVKKVKKKNLFRFLLSKVFYEEEGLHLDEYLVLWDLYLNLLELLSKDPAFSEKYESSFGNIHNFFEAVGDRIEFPLRLKIKDPRLQDLIQGMMPLLPTENAYFGLKSQKDLRLGFSILFSFDSTKRRISEGRRIGVGYRDHGTKKPDHEGTPHWSEVAQHFQELEVRSEEEYQGLKRQDPEFDWNRLWGLEGQSSEEEEDPGKSRLKASI